MGVLIGFTVQCSHHAQSRNPLVNNNLLIDHGSHKDWFIEGTAQWFEDEVYEKINSYNFTESPGKKILSVGLNAKPDKGKSDTRSYQRFSYAKLISSKCTDFKSNFNKMLNIPNGTSDPSGIKNFQNILPTLSCSFDGDLQTKLNDDTLASSFVYYNWATLLKNDISKLEGGESGFKFVQLNRKHIFKKLDVTDPHRHVLV